MLYFKKIIHQMLNYFGFSIVKNNFVDRAIFFENFSGSFLRYLNNVKEDQSVRKFLLYCGSQNKFTRSQLLQEYLYLYVRGTSVPEGAVFLEVGVGDGVNHSNNLMLERYFGMKGILVEGDPRQKLSIANNRNAKLIPVLAGETAGFEELNLADTPELSHVSSAHKTELISSYSHTSKVEVKTLNDILENELSNPKLLDYVTIDVEGFEIQVLRGFDLNIYQPAVLCIEFNYDTFYREKILEIIGDSYTLVFESISACDLWFVRTDLVKPLYE